MEGERGADVYQTFDDMKIERLVALALREMNGKNKAELKSVFKSLNIETNDKFIHEIVKYIKDKLKLKIPFINQMMILVITTRFCRTLNILVETMSVSS